MTENGRLCNRQQTNNNEQILQNCRSGLEKTDRNYRAETILKNIRKYEKWNDDKTFIIHAGGGTRTHTPLRITDFESVSSANSDTPAFCALHGCYHSTL